MKAIIDADIVAFRCSVVTENEEESLTCVRVEELIERIVRETNADKYTSFLTGEGNFRKIINPQYKANRTQPKPKHLQAARQFIMDYHNGVMCNGYEADDGMGITQWEDFKAYQGRFGEDLSTVICSIDKDMLMIPGEHYNFVKKESNYISELEGIKQLYRQALIGDSVDNIFGIKGIGSVKAHDHIDHLLDEEEMFEVVRDLYQDDERLIMNLDCLWIWREKDITWSKRAESYQLMKQACLWLKDGQKVD